MARKTNGSVALTSNRSVRIAPAFGVQRSYRRRIVKVRVKDRVHQIHVPRATSTGKLCEEQLPVTSEFVPGGATSAPRQTEPRS